MTRSMPRSSDRKHHAGVNDNDVVAEAKRHHVHSEFPRPPRELRKAIAKTCSKKCQLQCGTDDVITGTVNPRISRSRPSDSASTRDECGKRVGG